MELAVSKGVQWEHEYMENFSTEKNSLEACQQIFKEVSTHFPQPVPHTRLMDKLGSRLGQRLIRKFNIPESYRPWAHRAGRFLVQSFERWRMIMSSSINREWVIDELIILHHQYTRDYPPDWALYKAIETFGAEGPSLFAAYFAMRGINSYPLNKASLKRVEQRLVLALSPFNP